MKKKWNVVLVVLLTFSFLISGCSAGSDKAEAMDMVTSDSVASESYISDDMDFGMGEMNGSANEEESVEADDSADLEPGSAQAEEVASSSRKLIKRQYMTVETLEFDNFTTMVKSKVESVGGYIERSSVSGNSYYSSGRRYASYTVRVPVEKLDAFVSGIQENCNVTDFSEEIDDITLKYVDTESRIEALKIEQESLMKMLSEEGDLDTILRIQSRLTEVRYELQSYESQMRVYDNNIEYSTVYLDVYEVERTTAKDEGGFGNRLMERLSNNFFDMGNGLENFALFLLGGIPYWILLAVIVGIIVFIVKRIRGRKNMKQLLKETNADYSLEEVKDQKEEEKQQE